MNLELSFVLTKFAISIFALKKLVKKQKKFADIERFFDKYESLQQLHSRIY